MFGDSQKDHSTQAAFFQLLNIDVQFAPKVFGQTYFEYNKDIAPGPNRRGSIILVPHHLKKN